MNLVIDARMIDHAGIGRYLRSLLIRLKNSPLNIQAIVSKSSVAKYPWLSQFALIFCESPIYSLKEQLKIPLLIPKCALFWSPHYNVPLAPIRAKQRLVTIHDVYHLAFISTLSPLQKAYAKIVIKRAVNQASSIITDSEFSKNEIVKYTGSCPHKIQVIHPAVDREQFKEQRETKLAEVQKKYQLPEKYILFVGSLKPHKNLIRLVDALELILKLHSRDLHLVIVGKKEGLIHGVDLDRYLHQKSISKHVSCLGLVEDNDLPSLYQQAAALALPSLYEGFGLPALEAMSVGCPVVASNAASLPEVCGNSAEYVNPLDVQDICRGIVKLLYNDEYRKALVLQGKKRSQEFSWEKCTEEHLKAINLCIYK